MGLMWSGDRLGVSPSSTQNGPARPMDPPCVFPGLGCVIGIDTCGSWQELTRGVRAIMVARAKWKPLEFPIFPRIAIQKQFYILWGNCSD